MCVSVSVYVCVCVMCMVRREAKLCGVRSLFLVSLSFSLLSLSSMRIEETYGLRAPYVYACVYMCVCMCSPLSNRQKVGSLFPTASSPLSHFSLFPRLTLPLCAEPARHTRPSPALCSSAPLFLAVSSPLSYFPLLSSSSRVKEPGSVFFLPVVTWQRLFFSLALSLSRSPFPTAPLGLRLCRAQGALLRLAALRSLFFFNLPLSLSTCFSALKLSPPPPPASPFTTTLAVADVVRTSLGPKGMDKMVRPARFLSPWRLHMIQPAPAVWSETQPRLQFPQQIQGESGEVTITNDGATILDLIEVLHPAAKMVCQTSRKKHRLVQCCRCRHGHVFACRVCVALPPLFSG